MNEIKCPKCGTIFQIDELEYSSIVKQIRDSEFEREISSRDEQYKEAKENAIKLAEASVRDKLRQELTEKELEITKLKSEVNNKEEQTKGKLEKSYTEELNKKNLEIQYLESELKLKASEKDLDIQKAISEKDKEINSLTNKLELDKNTHLLSEKNLKETYEEKIKTKDEQIEYYRDFKAKQSTKMIGESLEQHCNNEFNRIRPLFKNVYFEKDNDAKTGSKGDFIFRNLDEGNTEIVSIMFEMKNEADETSTKHKNDDFLKELDKDRKEKGCEYAVLVTLLELDNDLYNNGIVDESHKYPKMYVIRPQFFIPIITLITGIADNSLKYKKELDLVRSQNIDISHFEENMNNFKSAFGNNYRLASEKYHKAIEEIDKSIEHLQKIKEALDSSERNLRLANNKAEDLSIKKLTHNSETVAKMFEEESKKHKIED